MEQDFLVAIPSPLYTQPAEPYPTVAELSSSGHSLASEYHLLVEATATVTLDSASVPDSCSIGEGAEITVVSSSVEGDGPEAAPEVFLACFLAAEDEGNGAFDYDTPESLKVNVGSASSTDDESGPRIRLEERISSQRVDERVASQHPSQNRRELDAEYRTSANERDLDAPAHRSGVSYGGSGPLRNLAARRTPRSAPDMFPYPRRARNRGPSGRSAE
ncbi:hypothetical protein QBC47DRAFT_358554 [Echria macrotheca]|uniref:Uncharacterized protein n=1 Tax=Echria macrotheca TaxID=438768 RepID=A0AAJ0BKW4_9PEZI|nr:hypothetical protein QBC47DRAFT_358554 [Echria macrotheca]